ncbi:hypothetical protein ACOMHN_061342 [Nucella lapillus]
MVATYVSSRLSYSNVQIPTDQVGCRLTTCAVSIPTHRGKQTNLVNVYYPNGSNSEADVEWLYNLDTNQNSWVVAGDFNVSHKLWDTGQTKDSGDHLANTILNSRLVVLNDGSFTRIGQPGQRSSAIDLTLTSPDLSLDAEWTIGKDHLQSDHLPLHLVLHKADPTPAEIDTSPKFLYHKADWELLALKLTSECKNHDPRDPDINTHYENIRFPEPALRMLHTFFQTCWTTGNIPKDWKKATVVAIPKNGKPPQQTSSYRPIALTPHLGKVYERVLKNRLDHHLEKNEILPLCQAGFRKGRNCMEHVVRLIEDTKKWSLKGKNKKTVATFFDIKKAFDSVWHAKLLNKMGALGITGRMYNFIQTFLDSREITVKVGPSVSRSHILDMGVPQGSVIAPTLFSIMLHDILTTLQPQKKPPTISLFADDLAIWSHISDHAITNQMPAFQRNIDSIKNYMSNNGTWNYQDIARIKVGDHIIRPSKQAKFLGVTLTPTFSWTEHINGLITKAMRGVSLIKMLTQETWVTPENLTHLTAALVRARLTYGHEAYFNAPKSQWQRLARTEPMALKHALGVCRGAVNDLVYQEVGWLPLKEECSRRCANFEIRTQTVNNTVKTSLQKLPSRDSTFRKHLERKKPAQHKRTTPLHDHTKVLWEKSNLNPEDVATAPISPIPPWELIKPRIIDTYETKETKHTNPLYLATLAKTRVHEEFGQHLQIYTDGSVKDNGEVGCALVIPDLGITKKYHLNNGISIYTAELYAILKACETINDMSQPPRAAIILTDSKSSLQGLASGRTKNRQEFQAEISFLTHQIMYKGTDLTLMWLPSHTGIKGNELADKAAKRATEDGTHVTLQLSTLEMKNKIRQTANNIRNDTLKTRCTEHGWVFIPMPKTSPRLTLPRKNQKLLRRIRTGHHRSTSQNITCQCGKEATLQHIFSDCPSLNSSTTKLKDYKQKHSLGTQDFLLPHPTLGTQPIRLLTDTIMNSETDQWF